MMFTFHSIDRRSYVPHVRWTRALDAAPIIDVAPELVIDLDPSGWHRVPPVIAADALARAKGGR